MNIQSILAKFFKVLSNKIIFTTLFIVIIIGIFIGSIELCHFVLKDISEISCIRKINVIIEKKIDDEYQKAIKQKKK